MRSEPPPPSPAHKHSGETPDSRSGIFVDKCRDCHNLDKVEAAQAVKTKAEMREILKRHKDMEGSGLTDKGLKALLKMYQQGAYDH